MTPPFPGMAERFEAHFGQSWVDPDWRQEASIWAAAWKAALSLDRPAAIHSPDDQTDE